MRVIPEKDVELVAFETFSREPHELTPEQRALLRKMLEMCDEDGYPLPDSPTSEDEIAVFQPDQRFERIRCMTEGARLYRERFRVHLLNYIATGGVGAEPLVDALKAAEAEALEIIPKMVERRDLIDEFRRVTPDGSSFADEANEKKPKRL